MDGSGEPPSSLSGEFVRERICGSPQARRSKKSQFHITHVKPVVIGFAFERAALQRSLRELHDMSGKIDTVYCILVVATAVLVGIVKCTSCSSIKTP
jgi:hypothetical protein